MSEFSCVIVAKSIVVRVDAKTTNPLNALGVSVDGRLPDIVRAIISLGEYVLIAVALNLPASINDASSATSTETSSESGMSPIVHSSRLLYGTELTCPQKTGPVIMLGKRNQ
ncbi:hypothetical protein ACFLUO_02455, partial [Chloroflexota bacterium]